LWNIGIHCDETDVLIRKRPMGTKIYLNNSQAALVLGKDGKVGVHIPKVGKDNEPVPDYIITLVGAAALVKTQDKKFFRLVKKAIQELVKKEYENESIHRD